MNKVRSIFMVIIICLSHQSHSTIREAVSIPEVIHNLSAIPDFQQSFSDDSQNNKKLISTSQIQHISFRMLPASNSVRHSQKSFYKKNTPLIYPTKLSIEPWKTNQASAIDLQIKAKPMHHFNSTMISWNNRFPFHVLSNQRHQGVYFSVDFFK